MARFLAILAFLVLLPMSSDSSICGPNVCGWNIIAPGGDTTHPGADDAMISAAWANSATLPVWMMPGIYNACVQHKLPNNGMVLAAHNQAFNVYSGQTPPVYLKCLAGGTFSGSAHISFAGVTNATLDGVGVWGFGPNDTTGVACFDLSNSSYIQWLHPWGVYCTEGVIANGGQSGAPNSANGVQGLQMVGPGMIGQNNGINFDANQVTTTSASGASWTGSTTCVMTITVNPTGTAQPFPTFQLGMTVVGTGIPANTTIASFGTAVGFTGTYNLSGPCTTETAQSVTAHTNNTLHDALISKIDFQGNGAGVANVICWACGAVQFNDNRIEDGAGYGLDCEMCAYSQFNNNLFDRAIGPSIRVYQSIYSQFSGNRIGFPFWQSATSTQSYHVSLGGAISATQFSQSFDVTTPAYQGSRVNCVYKADASGTSIDMQSIILDTPTVGDGGNGALNGKYCDTNTQTIVSAVPQVGAAQGTCNATTFVCAPQFNTSRLNPAFGLFNNNLTVFANSTPSGGNGSAFTTLGRTAGQRYFEWTMTTATAVPAVGLANTNVNNNNYLGQTSESIGYFANGQVTLNATVLTTLATYASTNVIQVAVDLTVKKIWFKVGSGGWNNDILANQNPAVGSQVGGISISGLSFLTGVSPSITLETASEAGTINLGGSPFTGTIPAGYSTWQN